MKIYVSIIILLASLQTSCNSHTQETSSSKGENLYGENRFLFISDAKPKASKDIDQIIENLSDSLSLEFVDLYHDTREIPEIDSSILTAKLKGKQFELKNYGRGNWKRGPRIISYWLESKDFICRVDKLYHSDTTIKGVYRITERIGCLRK
jgi:hypothetical protein